MLMFKHLIGNERQRILNIIENKNYTLTPTDLAVELGKSLR